MYDDRKREAEKLRERFSRPGRIHVESEYYITALVSLAEGSDRVLKYGDTFLVTDRHGDIRPLGFEQHGLFHKETRFLSRYVFRLERKSPPLLSSAVRENNELLSVDLTNPEFSTESGDLIRSGQIHISRLIFLWGSCYYEHIKIWNYGLRPVEFSFSLEFESDFTDIFEIRGTRRREKGEILGTEVEAGRIIHRYRGAEGVLRKTSVEISPPPGGLSPDLAVSAVKLGAHQAEDFYVTVSCSVENEAARPRVFDQALSEIRKWYHRIDDISGILETSNEQFSNMIGRARADLNMMITETQHGLYPYAGIPWFNTVFGRDGIITALEMLWLNPDVARGVLAYLADSQAADLLPDQDAEPGKILHEERKGEMAATREVPFGKYYGTIDATPLFIILAGYYYERTGDLEFLAGLWPEIEGALHWIDIYGDGDGDGFVEYARRSTDGLSNQGWKDSGDSVFHADGSLAGPPIALCEVQGYVYEAKMKAARLAAALGKKETARALRQQASVLREKFVKTFWCSDLGVYALALDGEKRLCRVRTSNAGQCLFSGIAAYEHARILVQNLLGETFFTGWGIRTLASSEARFNPMSYHNGSIWPHDNALVAFGMARYRFKEAAARVLAGFFDATLFLDLQRPPELFCGFDRVQGEGPTLYPVACHPQAWASGAVFLLLQACLGLSIQAPENKIYFYYPYLPPFLQQIRLRRLRLGAASVDIELTRGEGAVGINILRRDGPIEIVAIK